MNDIRLGLRHPVLTLAAIFSLALGIGANTAIFTVLNGSVLRPLPYEDPGRLMVVWETRADTPRRSVAPANFLDWRRGPSFSELAAFDDFSATLTGQGEAQRLRAVSASGNFFDILGVQAAIGRTVNEADDRSGAARVAVLSDGVWHRLFGGAASALGQSLILNDIPHTIVGILPPSFAMPMTADADIWMSGDPRPDDQPNATRSSAWSPMLAIDRSSRLPTRPSTCRSNRTTSDGRTSRSPRGAARRRPFARSWRAPTRCSRSRAFEPSTPFSSRRWHRVASTPGWSACSRSRRWCSQRWGSTA